MLAHPHEHIIQPSETKCPAHFPLAPTCRISEALHPRLSEEGNSNQDWQNEHIAEAWLSNPSPAGAHGPAQRAPPTKGSWRCMSEGPNSTYDSKSTLFWKQLLPGLMSLGWTQKDAARPTWWAYRVGAILEATPKRLSEQPQPASKSPFRRLSCCAT